MLLSGNATIYPAQQYSYVDDLWVISCFYNSNAYKTKPHNFDLFLEKIESSGLNYLIVECAFGKQPFSLKKSKNIIRVRTAHVMWQKERLLNIALQHLPAKCKKVAWLDCDVLFENSHWAKETSEKLNHYKVVQPFKECIRLPKGELHFSGNGDCYKSFGYCFVNNPLLVSEGKYFEHGHTGFGWASHKNILVKHGLYDVCIAGTADHMMVHSFTGDWDTQCIKRVIGNNSAFYEHYLRWSREIYKSVKSSVSYVDGALLHLWHGDVENRKYVERQKVIERVRFNPAQDIRLGASNCWMWNHKNNALKEWAKEYFVLRKEDH